jgi:Protein of unknown function (DUF3108).
MNPALLRAVALSVAALLPSSAPQSKMPFAIGERMEYEVRFGPLKVGNGHMEVVGIENIRGREAWHTAFWVQGGTFFYKVNDVYESWIDTATFSSLRFVSSSRKERATRSAATTSIPTATSTYEMHKNPPREHPAASQPLDDGSFLYFIRRFRSSSARRTTSIATSVPTGIPFVSASSARSA